MKLTALPIPIEPIMEKSARCHETRDLSQPCLWLSWYGGLDVARRAIARVGSGVFVP